MISAEAARFINPRLLTVDMESEICAAIRELGRLADRLGAPVEWDKLAEEQHGSPSLPPFRMREHYRQEILDMYWEFFQLRNQVQAMLNRVDIGGTLEQRAQWRRELASIESRTQHIDQIERYIRG